MNTREKRYTPGPWLASRGTSAVPPAVTVPQSSGRIICNCAVDSDAHLIAAAPELMEALEDLLSSCNVLGLKGELHQELHNARAAIAKAHGEQQ